MTTNPKTTRKTESEANAPRRANQKPVTVLRVGAVAASVWRRQTSTGFEYLDFSLSRSWRLKSGEKEGYSQCFFDSNEEALFEVIHRACRFIQAQQAEQESLVPLHRNVVVGDAEMAADEALAGCG